VPEVTPTTHGTPKPSTTWRESSWALTKSQFGYVIEAASADSAAQLAKARDFFECRRRRIELFGRS